MVGGLILGVFGGHGLAEVTAPSEHKGLRVERLGIIRAESVRTTVGLKDHFLRLRAITIEPGGQIAKHDHESRPGLVKVIGGSWVEGRESGETTFHADDPTAIIEDENTVHWFFNRGSLPATAIVCDLNPTT